MIVVDHQDPRIDDPTVIPHRLGEEQDEHMQTVWEKFDGSVRAIIPLYDKEIRGVPMLTRLGDAMFA